MGKQNTWDGVSKGSSLGHWIFYKLITLFGLLPAYALLVFVAFVYTVKDKKSGTNITDFRTHCGLKTSFFTLYRHFYAFGMNLLDRYAFLIDKQSFFAFETIREDLITQALHNKTGAILLGAHIGNWELAGNLLSDRIKADIHYVMVDKERDDMRELEKSAMENRRAKPIIVGEDGLALMIAVKNALSANGLVCMHGDRTMGQKSAVHNFLGADVAFPMGPFAIAAATGAPIIPIVVTKRGLKKYVFKAFAPMQFTGVTRENRDKIIFTAMERYVGILEQIVKEQPYQWFNFYDFWGT